MDFDKCHGNRPRRQQLPDVVESFESIVRTPKINRRPCEQLLDWGQAATNMKSVSGKLSPLRSPIADGRKVPIGNRPQLPFTRSAAPDRSNAGVPDRPAITQLDSLVTRVDSQHHRRRTIRVEERILRVGTLERKPAMMSNGKRLARVHAGS